MQQRKFLEGKISRLHVTTEMDWAVITPISFEGDCLEGAIRTQIGVNHADGATHDRLQTEQFQGGEWVLLSDVEIPKCKDSD